MLGAKGDMHGECVSLLSQHGIKVRLDLRTLSGSDVFVEIHEERNSVPRVRDYERENTAQCTSGRAWGVSIRTTFLLLSVHSASEDFEKFITNEIGE